VSINPKKLKEKQSRDQKPLFFGWQPMFLDKRETPPPRSLMEFRGKDRKVAISHPNLRPKHIKVKELW
jgi:hypothetical protein